jgi:hypothetical protein|tara:strand:- start:385 stop:708 length:324 start_codon:yes stop_codon:yes gene_type:complete
MYKIRGEIINLEDENISTQKGDYVKKLITIQEAETGFDHVQQFEIFGKEKIDVIETNRQLSTGQYVNIDFYIKSREYKGKFYNTLMVKAIKIEDSATRLSEEQVPFS